MRWSRSNASAPPSADIQQRFSLILNFFLLALFRCAARPDTVPLHDRSARCFDDPLYALTPMLAKTPRCLPPHRFLPSSTILITRSSGESLLHLSLGLSQLSTLSISSVQLEVHIRSPSVKIHRAANYDIRSLPVFGEQDKVSGQVLLDVSLCVTPGRLTIFVRTRGQLILALL